MKGKGITTIYDDYEGYSYDDVKQDIIERHISDYPEDTEWEPEDDEIYEEIADFNNVTWERERDELENFFDSGDVFILTGYAGLWNGRSAGGKVIYGYKDLSKAWRNVDYLQIYDERGKFCINGIHHDGTNHWEVRKLTKKGLDYLDKHEYDDPQSLHEKLFSKGYSVNPHYVKKVYGC